MSWNSISHKSCWLRTSAPSAKSPATRPLPSESAHENDPRRIAASKNGCGVTIRRFRMLRNGRPFGFEREKYSIAQAAGERVLLPAVSQASADTLFISDGFSCREQIRQSHRPPRPPPGRSHPSRRQFLLALFSLTAQCDETDGKKSRVPTVSITGQ